MVVERTVAREPEYLGSVGCSAIRASGRYRFSIVVDRAAQWSAAGRGPLGHSSCGAKFAMQLSTGTTDVWTEPWGLTASDVAYAASQQRRWRSVVSSQCRHSAVPQGIASHTLVCTFVFPLHCKGEVNHLHDTQPAGMNHQPKQEVAFSYRS